MDAFQLIFIVVDPIHVLNKGFHKYILYKGKITDFTFTGGWHRQAIYFIGCAKYQPPEKMKPSRPQNRGGNLIGEGTQGPTLRDERVEAQDAERRTALSKQRTLSGEHLCPNSAN